MNRTHALFSLTLGLTAHLALGCSGEDPAPTITKDPIEILTTALPSGQQGQPFSAEVSAKGGSGEGYRWSVIGALPAGLFMSSRGTTSADGAKTTILGTPQVNGSFSFEVRLTDGEGDSGSQAFTLTLAAPPPDLTITTAELPDGGTETAYDVQLVAENGTEPYAWTQVGGALPPGITLSTTGRLAGTPEDAGAFEFSVRVDDAAGKRASATLSITVQDESLPLSLLTTDLPDGVVDLEYSASLEASNGSPPYSWTVVGDAPPGLELEASGNPVRLQGRPSLAESYTFQIEVEDAAGARVRRTFFVEIFRAPPPLRIITLMLPGGEVSRPYSATVSGLNGSGSGYAWRVSQGALPPGLTLAAAGTPDTTLSGVPTQAGDYTFTVELRDDVGRVDETEFSVKIIPQIFPIEITTTSTSGVVTLPMVRLGETYSQAVSARNGFGQYHWVVSAGRLPAGMEVEVTGTPSTRITGLAGERGNFAFTVTVYDENNETASQDFALFVAGPEFPVNIVSSSVVDARACNTYEAVITAQQGSNVDYTWSISAGALPPGLSIDATGTPGTRIRGTVPEGATGTYAFTVQVQDSAGDVDARSYSIDVVDDGTGDRFVVLVGDVFVDNRYDIAVSPICQPQPGAFVQVSPPSGIGNADTGSTDFAMSPDGTKVAFIGDMRISAFDEVFVADLTGPPPYVPVVVSPASASTTVFDAFDLKWAPDGSGLAFMGDFSTDGYNEVYYVDTSGPLVANSAIPVAPALPSHADVDAQDYMFSPDGRWLAYAIDTEAASMYDAWVYDTSSGTARSAVKVNSTLPGTSADVNYPFVFSPDSRYLMYNCDCRVQLNDELWVVDLLQPTLTPRIISHAFSGSSGNVIWTSSEVAPQYFGFTANGRYAFYRSDLGDTALGDTLYAVDMQDPTGRGVPVYPRTASGLDVIYMRPAGRSGTGVVVMGDLEAASVNELYYFDLAQPYPLSPGTHKISGVMQPNGDVASYTDFEVSPNGDYVVFTADKVIEGLDQAYLVDLRGPTPTEDVLISIDTTDAALDIFNIYWPKASNWVALVGYPYTSGVYEVLGVNVAGGAPYEPIRLNPPMSGSEDVNTPVVWRSDGGGIFYEGDHGNPAVEEAWWVDVNTPGVATRLTTAPTNGDVLYIKAQGQ